MTAADRLMIRLEAVIEEFAKTVRVDLRRRSQAKNRCRPVSAKFAAFAAARGLPVEGILEMKFRYLGERKVAFRHHAVLVGSKVVDWTANQFFETSVPAVFDGADEWTQEIDESLGGRYGYPEVSSACPDHPRRGYAS
jgi:hypothetical protein